jgi:glycosyltransferase involved in cell wall biosynthesis
LSYCHNPFRYAWNDREDTLARCRDPLTRAFLRGLFRRWRQWDWIAAQRTNRYVANSRTTQQRIRAYFGRESSVVHPPVEIGRFSPGPVGRHYVIVSELMPHKRIDVAIAAFNQLQLPLIVVGDGPEARRLQATAGRTIQFAGRISDAEVADLLQSARALIMTAIEEFGIVAVESQAAGRPVIAARGGGALETIVEGVTGCFWSGGAEELARAVVEFDDAAVDPEACVRNASRFDKPRFRAGVSAEVARARSSRRRLREGDRIPLAGTRLVRRAARASER